MAQIREIKRRIKSINNTAKVTHAMELVAAAKMRKAQLAALAGRPYVTNLNQIIEQIRQKTSGAHHELLENNTTGNQLVIIVATDRGLVGGLNINLFRHLMSQEQPHRNAKYITVGKKAASLVARIPTNPIASFQTEEKTPLDLARTLTKMAVDAYVSAEVDSVNILYPDFITTIKQIPKIAQLLPIHFENSQLSTVNGQLSTVNGQLPTDLLFEPSPDAILASILPHYILTKIYQILLETKACEHSARMIAMKNATDAASDLVSDLTLSYNQARQDTITGELLDIVTAQSTLE